jgi:hypothetical protein
MPALDVLLGLAGIGLLLLARVRHVEARRAKRRSLRSALRAPDAATRRAAIQVVADQPVAWSVALLLELLQRETDMTVLLALAQVVVRNQWSPARSPDMIKLRLWAHRYLEEQAPPSWLPPRSPQAQATQALSVGDIVNLMIQPTHRRPHDHRTRRTRARAATGAAASEAAGSRSWAVERPRDAIRASEPGRARKSPPGVPDDYR